MAGIKLMYRLDGSNEFDPARAFEVVLQWTQSREDDELELDEKWIREKRV